MKKPASGICYSPTQKGDQMKLEYAISVLIKERNKILREICKLESEWKKLNKYKLHCDSELLSGNDVVSLLENFENAISKTIPENIRLLKVDLKSLNDALFYLCQFIRDNDWKSECNEITYN